MQWNKLGVVGVPDRDFGCDFGMMGIIDSKPRSHDESTDGDIAAAGLVG